MAGSTHQMKKAKDPVTTVRLPVWMDIQIKRRAKAISFRMGPPHRISKSDLIRKAVKDYLATNPETEVFSDAKETNL